ncbi:MAG: transcriptional regulator NrdR [Clostridia bacterium]|nr:transcriptional regulator NrdR [Clostridia bacterium]
MKCPYCKCLDSKVIDSRQSENGEEIRRRRECIACGKRFTTYETIETTPLFVIKNNGNRQKFDRNKIKQGIMLACANRPVPMSDIDTIVSNVESKIVNSLRAEVSSKEIGNMVMEELKKVDEVSYIRFASVYRQFKDTKAFLNEMIGLLNNDEDDGKKH